MGRPRINKEDIKKLVESDKLVLEKKKEIAKKLQIKIEDVDFISKINTTTTFIAKTCDFTKGALVIIGMVIVAKGIQSKELIMTLELLFKTLTMYTFTEIIKSLKNLEFFSLVTDKRIDKLHQRGRKGKDE